MKKIFCFYALYTPLLWYVSKNTQFHDLKSNFIEKYMIQSLENNLEHKSLSGFILALTFGFGTLETRGLSSLVSKLYLSTFFRANLLHLKPILNGFKKKHQPIICFLNLLFQFSPSLLKRIIPRTVKSNLAHLIIVSIILILIVPKNHFHVGIFISIFYWFTLEMVKDFNWVIKNSFLILTTLIWQTILGINFSITGFIFGQIFFYFFPRLIKIFILLTLCLIFFKVNFIESFYAYFYQALKFISNITIHFETSSTLLLFIFITLCLKTEKLFPICLFFIFKSDYVFTPLIYYSK